MIRRIARPLLGSVFVYTGYTGLTSDPGRKADTVAPLVEKATESLPDSTVIPTSARTWLRINSGVQLGGGLLLATGRLPRISSLALAGTLVPATVVDHPFWQQAEPELRREQQLHFVKNLSLLGGLLIAGFDTEGKPGATWRARRAAERASAKVSDTVSAITPHEHDDGAWRERAHAAQEYGVHAIERAKPAVTDAVERARPAVTDAVDRVGPAVTGAVDKAKPAVTDAVDRARPVIADAVDRVRPVLADAADTASDLFSAAGERLHTLRDEATEAVAERRRAIA